MRVALITNDTRFAYNLRREALFAMASEGHEVFLVAENIGYEEELKSLGIKLVDMKVDRRGQNPFSDIGLFFRLWKTLRKLRPQIVFTNNAKPNVYAGIACQFLRIRYVPNVTGLGTPLEQPGKLQKLTAFLYKTGVRKASAMFFQNQENLSFFEQRHMLPSKTKVIMLPGSGVNLDARSVLPYPSDPPIVFLYVARIMKEKGIDVFLDVAKHFRALCEDVSFEICGQCDDPKYLKTLEELQENGIVVYHGLQNDLMPFYQKCSCFLYPSYYPEGMSNVLLEAAACGRPVIACDRSGCRETVDDGVSGYVVPINDSESTIRAVESFLSLTTEERCKMGLAGRRKMEEEFDRKKVVSEYLKMLKDE